MTARDTDSDAPGTGAAAKTPQPDPMPVKGPIVISRHGRPALDRRLGPRLGWRDYVEWWDQYEATSLAPEQRPPADLVETVRDAAVVLSSMRPRALETAQLAAPHLPPQPNAVFNEAPLPPPHLPGVRYLPKTWNVLARAAWMVGHSRGGESLGAARVRARLAAGQLHEAARFGKVYLAAHGWFNRMLRPQLRALGWHETRDGGDRYWSFRVYEWRD